MNSPRSAVAQVDVSVVIPCYRCARTLGRAIDSVCSQSARAREVIVVLDGAPDECGDALQRYGDLIDSGWLRVVTLACNQGAANARNVGWAVATGRYVAFLDADDAWHPDKLAIQTEFMEAHVDIGLSGHRHVHVVSGDYEPVAAHGRGHHRISYLQLLLANRFVTPSVMLRREIGQRFKRDRRHMEDHLLWLEVAAAGIGVARLDAWLCAIFKAPFGASGLSADLWAMQRGELDNYRTLRQSGRLSAPGCWLLQLYSMAKFVRRWILIAIRARGFPAGASIGGTR